VSNAVALFVTMVVDHKNKRLMELVEGKSGAELTVALQHIPGRESAANHSTLSPSTFERNCLV